MGKDLDHKYSQNLFNTAKKSTADAIKTASKKAIQKPAETTSDLIVDKTTNLSKKFSKELHSQNENEIEIPKERYISPEKRQ